MPDLFSLVAGYLVSDGYNVQQRELAREVFGERPGPAGTRERIYVWVPEISGSQPFGSQERPYLERFATANERHPSATKVLVVPSTAGISTDFRFQANRVQRVGIRVPVQFFDTEFKWDRDPNLPGTAKQLKTDGEESDSDRIEQPFNAVGRYPGEGPDLVTELFNRMHGFPRRTGIHIVQGPAGIGKSYLFAALFARLHNAFLADKSAQRTRWGRPIPLLPEYSTGEMRLNGLLMVFMQSELERLIRPELFHWMLAQGQNIWMLDGLEEIMALDEDFDQAILESFTLPKADAEPTILMCLRDSLMNTNPSVIDFCTEYEQFTTIYTLERWKANSITSFAESRLGRRKGRAFSRTVSARPDVMELASLPYYAGLLLDQYEVTAFEDIQSAAQLVDYALRSIIQREYDKGLALSEDVISIDDVLTFAQDIAQQDLRAGFNGISVGNIRDWSQLWADLVWDDPSSIDRFVFQMSQMALFVQDPSTRRLRFTQEILEQYLLGRLYVDYLNKGEITRFEDEFDSWEFPEGSIALELLASYFRERLVDSIDLQTIVFASLNRPTAFKNIVQLLSVSGISPEFLQQSTIGKDLSNLRLREMDLSGVSLSNCDLSNTEFHRCNLRGSDFSGAIISNTGFFDMSPDLMQGAIWEDSTKFHSMRSGSNQVISRTNDARRWWNSMTSIVEQVSELPCGAAEQLRSLFRKFIYPDGRGRRDDLQEENLNRGQRHVQNPSSVTDGAIKQGYLSRSSPTKFRRADGPKYAEMVEYVKTFTLSHDLRFLLDDVCGVDGCSHVSV